MPGQDEIPLWHSNQYSVDSACAQCQGIIRHEAWCVTLSGGVFYVNQAVLDANHLSPGDRIILHALGVTWMAKSSQPEVRKAT